MTTQRTPHSRFSVFLHVFASSLFLSCFAPSLLADRTNYAVGILAGINGVFDTLQGRGPGSPPAVCVLDPWHPDAVRASLRKEPGKIHVAYLEKLRKRVEELSGLPCLVAHYTQVTTNNFRNTNIRALIISAQDKGIPGYRDQLLNTIRHTPLPMIGFCGGHQLIAEAFGGTIGYMRPLRAGEKDPRPTYQPGQFKEWGFMAVRIIKRDPLFEGLGDRITVNEMHAWEIKRLPEEFEVLASTDECRVEAIKHKSFPIYGTQFHAEQYDDRHTDGKTILRNFFTIAGVRVSK